MTYYLIFYRNNSIMLSQSISRAMFPHRYKINQYRHILTQSLVKGKILYMLCTNAVVISSRYAKAFYQWMICCWGSLARMVSRNFLPMNDMLLGFPFKRNHGMILTPSQKLASHIIISKYYGFPTFQHVKEKLWMNYIYDNKDMIG